MIFPFWYIGEKVFYKPDDFDLKRETKNLLYHKNVRLDSDNYFYIQGNIGLFKMPSRIKLKLDADGVTLQVKYYISLFESNIILLLGVVLGVFFLIMQKQQFSYIAFLAGSLFYVLNAVFINNFLKSILHHFGSFAETVEQQALWRKQKEWLKKPDICSACGEPVNPYSTKCVSCGMHYKNKTLKGNKPTSNITYS